MSQRRTAPRWLAPPRGPGVDAARCLRTGLGLTRRRDLQVVPWPGVAGDKGAK